jgi:hypothetical protein
MVIPVAGFSFNPTGVRKDAVLKIYDKQDDIPEGLRAEYKQSGARWVPDLSDDHPVLVLNKTLKQEKDVEEAKVKKLRSDLDDALEAGKTSNVPRGHVTVPKADAELLEKLKPLGTAEVITAKLTEYDTLKADAARRTEEDKRVAVATELGYNPEAFKRLSNLPDFEVREKDGKKSVVALVKDGDKVVEKVASEYLESDADIAPFLPALKTKPTGVTVNATSSTTTPRAEEPFAWAKSYAENHIKTTQPATDWTTSFGAGKQTI